MASTSYTSFPHVADEPASSTHVSLDQLRMTDNPSPVASLKTAKCVEIEEDSVVGDEDEGEGEDEIATSEFRSLDCAGYQHHHHLGPVTPTKERSRRATMPEPTKPRPQDVSFILPFPVFHSSLLFGILSASIVLFNFYRLEC